MNMPGFYNHKIKVKSREKLCDANHLFDAKWHSNCMGCRLRLVSCSLMSLRCCLHGRRLPYWQRINIVFEIFIDDADGGQRDDRSTVCLKSVSMEAGRGISRSAMVLEQFSEGTRNWWKSISANYDLSNQNLLWTLNKHFLNESKNDEATVSEINGV